MDSVCASKDRAFKYVTKTKIELNQNFRRFLLNYQDKATIKIAKIFPGMAKAGILLPRDGICHPLLPHGYVPGTIKALHLH